MQLVGFAAARHGRAVSEIAETALRLSAQCDDKIRELEYKGLQQKR